MAPSVLAQATLTDETDRHAGANGNVIEPVVMVASVYVPSLLAVQVPVTCKDPDTGTVLHPRLAKVTSMSPDRFRHDDVTVQVPTTDPPQGVAPGQLEPPAAPEVPPVALDPPEPGDPPEPPARPPELQPSAAAAAIRTVMSRMNVIRIGGYLICQLRGVSVKVFSPFLIACGSDVADDRGLGMLGCSPCRRGPAFDRYPRPQTRGRLGRPRAA
jgi:hypothetical protein